MKVTVCLISTKKYRVFVKPLIDSIKKYFLLNHQIEIVLFTDDISTECDGGDRVKIEKDLIVSWGFPEITLRRYLIMTSRDYNCDYLYYLDVDYLIVGEVGAEILGDIVAVLHPGFYRGGGSWCEDKNSNAFTYPENRIRYYCGGTQGGKYEYYYPIMKRLAREIQDDENRGIIAVHNDESYYNKLLSELKSFKVLDPSYCMVEQPELQEQWGIDHLPKRIIALSKDHNEIRK